LLRRTVTLHCEGTHGWVALEDEVVFGQRPAQLESPLMTFGRVSLDRGAATIVGANGHLRVAYDPALVEARVEEVPAVDLAEGPVDVRRLVLSLRSPTSRGAIRLRLSPG
jgi:hypothetical protein